MINPTSLEALNFIGNRFRMLATMYYGILCAMKTGGYAEFVKWESSERWATLERVREFVELCGHEFISATLAAPKQDFKTIIEALALAYQLEIATIAKAKELMKKAFDVGDHEVYLFMGELIEEAMKNTMEVKKVHDDHQNLMGEKTGVFIHSKKLYDYYEPKNHPYKI